MNHKFLSYLTPAFMAIAMGLGFAACSEDAFDSGSEGEGQITITLSSSKVASRAQTPGEDRLNENLIGETRLYFYPESSSDTEQPIFEHSVDPNKTSSATVTLLMKQAKDLFGETGNTCKVYALTNIPDWSKITDDHSRSALRRVAITSPFENIQAQTSFVMDGEGTVTLDRDNQSAKGTIQLVRSAAKIILSVNVADEIEENGAKWHSNTNDMFVSFAHIVKTSIVDNKTDDSFMAPDFENDMVSKPVSTETGHKFIANTADTYPFVQEIPFYTYPNKCIDATADTDVKHPYITFMVQWQKQGEAGAEAQYCYYQIPIGKHGDMKLDRNNIYRINLNVSKLGSFVETEAVELDMSYEVVNWSSVDTDVDIEDYRYLVLNQTEYTMNNENEITIPFYSSHEVQLSDLDIDVELTYWIYNIGNGIPVARKVTRISNGKSQSEDGDKIFTLSINNENKTITFKHDLSKTWYNSNYNEKDPAQGTYISNLNEAAYSPYQMKLTFHHYDLKKDNPLYNTFSKTVIINQYPEMYIEVKTNSYYMFESTSNSGKGFVFENGKEGSGLGGNNANPNMYVIDITKLSTNDYYIGDPRITDPVTDFNNSNSSTRAPHIDGENNVRLRNYYPTASDEVKAKFIAPIIRIASSYGKFDSDASKNNAYNRCARYQEDGRPAGRWRIPTTAEVEYIVNLSKQHKIPYLFGYPETQNSTANYWTASGIISVNNNKGTFSKKENTTRGSGSVRCVYDEWYWRNDTLTQANKKTFTWGDRPYSDPEIESSTNP